MSHNNCIVLRFSGTLREYEFVTQTNNLGWKWGTDHVKAWRTTEETAMKFAKDDDATFVVRDYGEDNEETIHVGAKA